ncbi:MAG: glycosyltransferase family 2 protein [Acidobacteria bacterium]|nr:glycosyltransferase family 2 protein [Acidobacteriota bacterium]
MDDCPVDVSVVTATRNRADAAQNALRSIAAQRLHTFESLLVDDGSEAEQAGMYREVVGSLDPRFRLLQPLQPGEIGSGPALARNRGIHAARGRYIAFLDDDDVWISAEHLSSAVSALDGFKADIYCADMQGFRGDRLVYASWFTAPDRLRACPRVQEQPALHQLTRRVFVESILTRVIHPNMLVIRRSLIERAGAFLPSLRFAEDTEFVLRLADHTDRIIFNPLPAARYRLPEGNAHSLSMDATQQDLQTLAAAESLIMRAATAEVRRAAAVLESWTLRRLSIALIESGNRVAAIRTGLQGVIARPSLGAIRDLVHVLVGAHGSNAGA